MNTDKISPKQKQLIVNILSRKIHPHPRIWTTLFINPFFHKRGKGSKVCSKARMDVFPWHKFELGSGAIIEDYAVVNNGAGDVFIGEKSRIGIGSVLVGPVKIGDRTSLGPHVHIAGFNHTFDEGDRDWNEQGLTKKEITVGKECLIGANAVVVAGVNIGDNVQIGAGSVVTKDIPSLSVAVGNPAKVIKRYNCESRQWEKVK